MKRNMVKRLFSLLVVVVWVLGMVPASVLTVLANEPIVINEIKTKMAKDNVPRAGMEVTHFMPNVPDGEPYERPWN